jgi:hypothetical protein
MIPKATVECRDSPKTGPIRKSIAGENIVQSISAIFLCLFSVPVDHNPHDER